MGANQILVVVGQIISVLLFLFLGSLLINMKILGNGAICDPEQIFLFGTWLIFISLGIGLLVNSWFFYLKGKWKKYRVGLIFIISIFLFLSIFLRQIIMIGYGEGKFLIERDDRIYVKIKLYNNGDFFAYTYDLSCESENIGIYKLKGNILTLEFKNEKSEYLGTKYQIENNLVNCLDCKNKYELKIKPN